MRNLTYTLSPHPPFAALTDPSKKGVKGRSRTPKSCTFSPTPEEPSYVDGIDKIRFRAVRFN